MQLFTPQCSTAMATQWSSCGAVLTHPEGPSWQLMQSLLLSAHSSADVCPRKSTSFTLGQTKQQWIPFHFVFSVVANRKATMKVSLQHCSLQVNFTFAKHTLTQLLLKMYCPLYLHPDEFQVIKQQKNRLFFFPNRSEFSELRAFFFFFSRFPIIFSSKILNQS